MVVPRNSSRKINRGDVMDDNKCKIYKIGNTTVKIIPPPPMTAEEIDRVLDRVHRVGWTIIQELVEKGEVV